MATKKRDFGQLAAGLAELTGQTDKAAAPSPTPAMPAVPAEVSDHRGRGRPTSDTKSMQLRLPSELQMALVKDAAAASVEEGRNVTPQQIIIRILEARYNG